MLRFVSPLENTQFGFRSMPCVGTGSFVWLPQPLEGGQFFRGSQESALDTNSNGATATMGKDNDKARKGHFLWPHLAIRPGCAAQSLRESEGPGVFVLAGTFMATVVIHGPGYSFLKPAVASRSHGTIMIYRHDNGPLGGGEISFPG